MSDIDAKAVADYLAAHPDFFAEHDELLLSLSIPHERGSAISLVERQLKLLRDRNAELRQRLTQLMDVARDNDRLFEKTRRLLLALLDATSQEEIIGIVEDSLRHEFQIEFTGFILISEQPCAVGRSVHIAEAKQAIGSLLDERRIVCGPLREHERAFLFGQEHVAAIGSAAVVGIYHQSLHGVLAIASRDPEHYKSSIGTLFLGHIAEILARLLPATNPALRSVR